MKRKVVFVSLLISFLILFGKNNVFADSSKQIKLDYPLSNYGYQTQMYVQGCIDKMDDYTIETTIDDQVLDIVYQNYNYGKDKIGYYETIDLTGIKDGSHNFKVILKDNQGVVLSTDVRKINIKKYNMTVNFDYPIINYNYDSTMYIQGNMVNYNDSFGFELYIDNEKVNNVSYKVLTNNKKMFYVTSSVEQLNEGKHVVRALIKDRKTGEISAKTERTINVKKYKVEVNFDYPIVNYNYDSAMYVQGNIKSINDNLRFELYIDNDKINDISYRNLGNNKKMFYKTVVLDTLNDGTHIIRAVVINNKTGEVAQKVERRVLIKSAKPQVVLEYPIESYGYQTVAYLQGYINGRSNDVKVTVKIDGQVIEDNLKYYTKNMQKGFYETLDMSNYKDGKHNIEVELSKNNQVLSTTKKTINIKKYNSISHLDYPLTTYTYKNILYFQGYVMSTDSNKDLIITIDDNKITNYKLYQNKDIYKKYSNYGDKTANPTPNFEGTITTENLTDGKHIFKVKSVDKKTGEVLTQSIKEFYVRKYEANVNVEYPININYKQQMYVQGYIDTDIKNSSIELIIDGKQTVSNVARYQRTDIKSYKYGNSNTNKNSGFYTTIDTSNFKDGVHKLTINVYSNTPKKELVSSKVVSFKVKKYDGIIKIESPSVSLFSSQITLKGWELSELDNSYIKYYIDNKDITSTLVSSSNRYERNDISNTNYGSKALNVTPGFTTVINLNSISVGSHILTLKLFTKLNEEIYSINKEIFIYKNVYHGIDVSQHNVITSWSAVKNSGVDYAFIRAGVRGYGINSLGIDGNLRADDQFENYVRGATNNGIKVGAYVFSQAISEIEAVQEANLIINKVNSVGGKSKVTLPLVFDTEFSACNGRCGRADSLTKQQRTNITKAFLSTVKAAGYTPMIYASKDFLINNLDMSQLVGYEVWLAHYTVNGNTDNPLNYQSNYNGAYQVWQYTSKGQLPGISGNVDMNMFFKKY